MKDIFPGTILKIEIIKYPIFVVSNKYFNDADGIIGCPIVKESNESVTHVRIDENDVKGFVLCEQIRFFDIGTRGFKIVTNAELNTMVNIVDIVQGFFDF